MNLAGLDLNLLVPLDVLLQEQSVSRAATRLGLAQPTVSGTLARLRRHFDDPLLARVGNSYHLTPLAQQLRLRTARAIDEVQRVFASEDGFDPTTSQRTFVVHASDYAMAVVGPPVAQIVSETAHRVTLRFEHHVSAITDDWLRTVDAMILPKGIVFDLPSLDLFTDGWVCLVDRENDRVGQSLTMTDVAEMPWVLTYHGPTRFTAATRQLELLGIEPLVHVVVESFLALPYYLHGTGRLALIQRRLGEMLAATTGLRVLECPWEVVPVAETLWWHPVHTLESDHAWLRSVLATATASLGDRADADTPG